MKATSTLVSKCQILISSVVFAVVCLASFNSKAAVNHIVMAEVYGGGGNSGAVHTHDFVVLFNPTASGVDINGWSIQYSSATGPSGGGNWLTAPIADTSTIIPPGSYFLVKMASGGANGAALPASDGLTNGINMSATAGKVALCNITNALNSGGVPGCAADSSSIVDLVGYGSTANCSETSQAPAPSASTSLQRKDGGCTDTDNNANDFLTGPPTPRNSSSPTQNCDSAIPPEMTGEPSSRTNNAGTTATFIATASGTSLNYKWLRNGSDITEINASGITSGTLTITNVIAANAGSYHVVITNSAGTATSQIATLTVIDPAINTQPTSRTNVVGDTANFFASAGGTSVIYQWYRNGTEVSGGTDATLNVTNVQSADAGTYWLVASNSIGTATSSAAILTILPTPAVRLARWAFTGNGNSSTAPAPSETVTTASAALIGGTTATFASGSFSDPSQVEGLINNGWNTATYPAASANNKTAGIQFNVSTVGYQSVFLFWEQRHSNTASKYARLQYSSNGADFTDGPVITMQATNNSFVVYSANLSGVASLNNNANAAFRIVSEFENTATGSGASSYVPSVTGNTYGTGGTIRFDLISVYGDVIGTATPIPLTIQRSGGNVILSWENESFALQACGTVNGTFTNVAGATSPFTTPASGSPTFFRLLR